MINNFKTKKNDLFAVLTVISAVFLYTLPLLLRLGKAATLTHKNCITAWYRAYFFGLYPYVSMFLERQFPLWCPFREGGFPWIVFPVELSCNLFSLFMLPMGVVRGLNFGWYILYFVGALSMFYLTRKVLKYNVYGATYSSIVFSMCGFFSFMQTLRLNTRETLLLPLLVVFLLKSKQDNRFIIFTSLVLSLFVNSLFFFPVVVLFLFLVAVLNTFKKDNFLLIIEKRYLVIFTVSLIVALFLSAYKLLPIMELLKVDRRVYELAYNKAIVGANTFSLLARHMFIPENSNVGTMYLGFLPVLLCLFSVILYFKHVKKWFIILVIFIIITFGPNSFFDLNYLLWHLPILKSIREISKYYSLITVFLISLICGRFFPVISRLKKGKSRSVLPVIIILITFIDLLSSNIGYFNIYNTDLILRKPRNYVAHVKAINVHKGDEGGIEPLRLSLYLNGFGLINAQYHNSIKYFKDTFVTPKYFVMPEYVFIAPSTKVFVLLNPAYRAEAYFFNEKNRVDYFSITPGSIDIKANISEPDTIIINQKYSKGWKSEYGETFNSNGLLAVKMAKIGEQSIRLKYIPGFFYRGIVISVLTLLAICCAFFYLVKRI
ncbi:MAG: YfhO family protein [Candidatus Omnitrophica bacterium]|nr:YfhO family protein [Candidatus Omnitrophota bacterium]